MMYGYNDGWGWGAWLVMGFMMLAFWGGLAALIVYLVRSSDRRHQAGEPPRTPNENTALRLLDERFARGEIDTDEYTRRRDLLRAG